MVLLEIGHLFTQGFVLQLLVSPAERQLVQDSPQPVDVSLCILVKRELIFVPSEALSEHQHKGDYLKSQSNKASIVFN